MKQQTPFTIFHYTLKNAISFCLFFIVTISSYAQNYKPDLVDLSHLSDKAKIDTLKYYLVQAFENGSPETLVYADLLEKEGIRQNNFEIQAIGKAKIVEYYAYQFDNDSIFYYAPEVEEFARAHKEWKTLFSIQQILLQRYAYQDEYTKAINKGKQMYNEAKGIEDLYCMAQASAGLGNVYKTMIMSEDALKYFREALSILRSYDADPSSNMRLKLDLYNSIASVYNYQIRDPDMVLIYTDSMEFMVNKHKEYNKKLNYPTFYFHVATNYADAYTEKDEFELAKTYIAKADSMCNDDWIPSLTMVLDLIKSHYYLKTKEYSKALIYIDRLIDFLERNDLYEPAYYAEKAEILAYLGRKDEAIELYTNLHEKIREQNIKQYSSQISQLRTLYDLDKLEIQAEKDKLQIELMQQRISMFMVIFILLFTIIFIIVIYMRRIKKKNIDLVAQIREQDLMKEKLEKLNEVLEFENLTDQSEEQTSPNEKQNQNALIYKLNSLFRETLIYTDPLINRKILADKLGTNENYLRSAIKDRYDYTINEYINEYRINHAKKLLASDQYSIEEIAISSGFGTRSTMYRQFKEKYGLSPDEYRRSLKSL